MLLVRFDTFSILLHMLDISICLWDVPAQSGHIGPHFVFEMLMQCNSASEGEFCFAQPASFWQVNNNEAVSKSSCTALQIYMCCAAKFFWQILTNVIYLKITKLWHDLITMKQQSNSFQSPLIFYEYLPGIKSPMMKD